MHGKELIMAGIVKGAAGLVGNTPLLEPVNLEKKEGLKARILLKLEYFNPAGSVKDRVGKAMIEDAEARGVLFGAVCYPSLFLHYAFLHSL